MLFKQQWLPLNICMYRHYLYSCSWGASWNLLTLVENNSDTITSYFLNNHCLISSIEILIWILNTTSEQCQNIGREINWLELEQPDPNDIKIFWSDSKGCLWKTSFTLLCLVSASKLIRRRKNNCYTTKLQENRLLCR